MNCPKFETRVWKASDISEAAAVLREGKTVAFPTETVYGLGANACSDEAVKGIFAAKGRPADNPLIVHVASVEDAENLASLGSDISFREHFRELAKEFWPGPLTLVVRQNTTAGLSNIATAGLDTVGIRVPGHGLARSLIKEAGVPVAAPSANTSGKPSPTCADHVLHDMSGRIAGVLRDENDICSNVGLESTVLDISSRPYTLLRPGAVTLSQLQNCIGRENVRDVAEAYPLAPSMSCPPDEDSTEQDFIPRAPGMKYIHYAPQAPLHYVDGSMDVVCGMINTELGRDKRIGLMCPQPTAQNEHVDAILRANPDSVKLLYCGKEGDSESIARELYECLRRFDRESNGVDVIISFGFPQNGIGAAIQNRIRKASTSVIVDIPEH